MLSVLQSSRVSEHADQSTYPWALWGFGRGPEQWLMPHPTWKGRKPGGHQEGKQKQIHYSHASLTDQGYIQRDASLADFVRCANTIEFAYTQGWMIHPIFTQVPSRYESVIAVIYQYTCHITVCRTVHHHNQKNPKPPVAFYCFLQKNFRILHQNIAEYCDIIFRAYRPTLVKPVP